MKNKPTQFYFWLFIVAFTVSFVLFTLPGDDLPSADWLNIPYFDKLVHAAIFTTLCFTCFWWINALKQLQNIGLAAFFIAVLFLLYGIGIEFYQEMCVKSRAFELADIAADATGCGIFVMFIWLKKVGPRRNGGLNQN